MNRCTAKGLVRQCSLVEGHDTPHLFIRPRGPLPPTQRQLELHAYMLTFQLAHGMPPTVRELANAFGIKSTNAASDHLRALVKKGLVRHRPNVARAFLALEVAQQEGATHAP
jgi:SOS-response transcriptional repressor LexA